MHVLYVYMFYIVLFKYMHVIASVIHFCNYIIISLLTHLLHLNPTLNLPITPNLFLNLPIPHLNTVAMKVFCDLIWTQ